LKEYSMANELSANCTRHLHAREVMQGETLHRLWRLQSGAMRMESMVAGGDPLVESEAQFVRLVLPGDVIGAEQLVGVRDPIALRALTACDLAPIEVNDDAELRRVLWDALAISHVRCREVVSLRIGTVEERLKRLLRMLAVTTDSEDSDLGKEGKSSTAPITLSQCALPSLSNMALIINAAPETVCRVLSHFKVSKLLQEHHVDKVKPKRLEDRSHRLQSCSLT
jgi:hypothetical protein